MLHQITNLPSDIVGLIGQLGSVKITLQVESARDSVIYGQLDPIQTTCTMIQNTISLRIDYPLGPQMSIELLLLNIDNEHADVLNKSLCYRAEQLAKIAESAKKFSMGFGTCKFAVGNVYILSTPDLITITTANMQYDIPVRTTERDQLCTAIYDLYNEITTILDGS